MSEQAPEYRYQPLGTRTVTSDSPTVTLRQRTTDETIVYLTQKAVTYLTVLRALAHRQATPVTGPPGWVDVRVPCDVWERAKEAGE